MFLLTPPDFFSQINLFKHFFKNSIRVSNSFNPDQDRHLWVKTVCKCYQRTTKVLQASKVLNELAPVLKTICHQCVISYTCGQSNSDGTVNRIIRVRLAKVYDMRHWRKIVLKTGASLSVKQCKIYLGWLFKKIDPSGQTRDEFANQYVLKVKWMYTVSLEWSAESIFHLDIFFKTIIKIYALMLFYTTTHFYHQSCVIKMNCLKIPKNATSICAFKRRLNSTIIDFPLF